MSKNYVISIIAGVSIGAAISYGVAYSRSQNNSSPGEFSLPVPFTTQAPLGNWEGNENCEETSSLMASAFLNGNTANSLNPKEAQKSIDTSIAWENKNLGYNLNTGALDTAKMIEGVYHLKTKPLENFTEADLKRELTDGHVVLLPINAQGLNHPNYQRNDVVYHMIVIRGFNDKGFIVHDPGTNAGRDNVYAFDKLYTPAADWDQANKKILPDQKIAIAVWK